MSKSGKQNGSLSPRDLDIKKKSGQLSGYGSLKTFMQRRHGDKYPEYSERETKQREG